MNKCLVKGPYGPMMLDRYSCDYFVRWVDKKPYGGVIFYFWESKDKNKKKKIAYAYFSEEALEVHSNPDWADKLYAETFKENLNRNKNGWASFWEGKKLQDFSLLGEAAIPYSPIYVREDKDDFIITYLTGFRYEEFRCKSYSLLKNVQIRKNEDAKAVAELTGCDGKKYSLYVQIRSSHYTDRGQIYHIHIK